MKEREDGTSPSPTRYFCMALKMGFEISCTCLPCGPPPGIVFVRPWTKKSNVSCHRWRARKQVRCGTNRSQQAVFVVCIRNHFKHAGDSDKERTNMQAFNVRSGLRHKSYSFGRISSARQRSYHRMKGALGTMNIDKRKLECQFISSEQGGGSGGLDGTWLFFSRQFQCWLNCSRQFSRIFVILNRPENQHF